MELVEFKLTEFLFTVLMPGSSSCTVSFSMVLTTLLLALLHMSWKWLSLPHMTHLLPYTGHHLSLCSCPQHLQLLLMLKVFVVGLWSVCLTSFCTIASKIFASCKLLNTTAWALLTSTLFAHGSTFSLCIVIFSSYFVISLIISTSISSAFKPCIIFFFCCLSISLWWQLTTAVLNLPIHSSMLSLDCLMNL